jgi:hypothetical protein
MKPLLTAIALLGCVTSQLWGQAVPEGGEFQVNTYTSNNQGDPAVAMDGEGRFVAVWFSSDQDDDQTGIFGQRFDESGRYTGGEFQVNSFTSGSQFRPAVATDDLGGFMVVWESRDDQDGSGSGLFGQLFDSMGAPEGLEFPVNSYTTGAQLAASIAADPAGRFVIVWHGSGPGDDYGIFGQRFGTSGAPQGDEFLVNSTTTGTQLLPAVAADDSGGFVVVWTSSAQDGSGTGIFGQRFDSTGTAEGAELQVNTYTTGTQRNPTVATGPDGQFVVAWESKGPDGSGYAVSGQRFDSTGAAQGGEFQANAFSTGDQVRPAIATGPSGAFIVVWDSFNSVAGPSQDGDANGVFGQSFDMDGLPLGGEFQVNTYTTGSQSSPTVARVAGAAVVLWNSLDQDGSGVGVFAQRFLTEDEVFDEDGDGVPDDVDACLGSDLGETVVLGECDSHVANELSEDGCTISDRIAQCGATAANHGRFVRCVSQLTNDLKRIWSITGREKGAIQRCAAQLRTEPQSRGPVRNHRGGKR